MREKVSAEAIERFMKALGHAGKSSARIYFVDSLRTGRRAEALNDLVAEGAGIGFDGGFVES